MPGSRAGDERTECVVVRVTAAEKAVWDAHVKACGGYLSQMVRETVNRHLVETARGPKHHHW